MYGYEIFHESIMNELIKTVHNNTAKQAYLFVGPVGVGKKISAKLFAQSLVCTNSASSPCGACAACVGTKSDTNPDVVYIRPTENKTVSVKQIREVIADVYVKPFHSAKKVYIIESAKDLLEPAQNSLLKVLEEPPEYAVFIIISESESFLLQTILSRCTVIRFPLVDDEAIYQFIKNNYPEEENRKEILAKLSNGSPKAVDDIINNPDFNNLRETSLKMLLALVSKHLVSAYQICEFLENNKENTELIFDFWDSFFRDIMCIKNGCEHLITNSDLQEQLKNLSFRMDDNFPIIALEQLILARRMSARDVNLHFLALNLSFSIKNRLYGK